MKVKELIAKLMKFDPEKEIVIEDDCRGRAYPTDDLTIKEGDPYFPGDKPRVSPPFVCLKYWP